uniref:Phosphate-starvation-inducible E-like protein n=1 Tax=Thermodesulfobacterium geofontis TaxID=1295609 RepID=A0A7V5XGJ9_9BACT
MKINKNFGSWRVFGETFLLKAEEIGYYLISIGLLIGFAILVFDGFKILLNIFSYENFSQAAILFLDKILIALIFIEIFYTVQVALLEKSAIKCVEPFLLVAITALVRRLLILSFEISHVQDVPIEKIKYSLIELVGIGFLILALIWGLILLRKTRREKNESQK